MSKETATLIAAAVIPATAVVLGTSVFLIAKKKLAKIEAKKESN